MRAGSILRSYFLATLFGILIAGNATLGNAEELKSCAVLFQEDSVLHEALPMRIRLLLDSSRGHVLLVNREQAWTGFFKSLDAGLFTPEKVFTAETDRFSSVLHFRVNKEGSVALDIVNFKEGLSSFALLDFIGAQVAWISKKRSEKALTGIEIRGLKVSSQKAVDLLESIGFKKGRLPPRACFLAAGFGGTGGYFIGNFLFMRLEDEVENGSPEDERRHFYRDTTFGGVLGGGLGTALFCFRKTGRDYSFTMASGEAMHF